MDFLIPLFTVGLAEFGDKTMLAVLLLSSKTRRHWVLLAGVMSAFFIVDGAAVLLGATVLHLIPEVFLRNVSGAVFLIFGVLLLLGKENEEQPHLQKKGNVFRLGFLMIFLAEWGDKTQIASGLLATRYQPIWVLAGTLAALALLSSLAIYAGKWISARIHQHLIQRVAGILFILIGISFIIRTLSQN